MSKYNGEKMYRRLVEKLNSKGKLIPANDDVFKHIVNTDIDHYLSVYMYNEDQKKRFYEEIEEEKHGKKYKTIKGAADILNVSGNQLFFDFDKNKITSLEQAKDDTIEAIKRLNNIGVTEDQLQLYFSGNKGFCIVVNITECINPEIHKNVARNLVGDLETWDTKVYNASRIFRIPHTKHPESKLYKTPLEIEDLELPINKIKKLAKTDWERTVNTSPKFKVPKHLYKKKEEKKEIVKKDYGTLESNVCTLDFKKKPKWLSHWKYALSEGYFPPGSRNSALMILGATYQGQGLNKLTTYRMLKGAAELQSKKFDQSRYSDEEIWTNIIEEVYSQGWNGGTYSEENFPEELQDYLSGLGIERSKVEEEPFITTNDVYETFENFAENIEANTIRTGITELDKKCRVTTSMLWGLLGSPGSGKTATILNILNNHSLEGESSIFFSLDMGKPLVYQKLAQKFTGYQADDLFKIFKEKDEKEKVRIRQSINKGFDNTQMCFKTGATVDDMRRYIEWYQDKSGKKVRFVAVDYLEKIVGPFSDPTANSGYNAAKLQEICNDLELCILLLLQPQKMAGDPSEPLLTYRRVKGASIIEQDCRVIMSCYREGYASETYENDNFITYAILKNTMGELGTVDCYWTGLTGVIEDIDDTGKEELKKIREKKKERAMAEGGYL